MRSTVFIIHVSQGVTELNEQQGDKNQNYRTTALLSEHLLASVLVLVLQAVRIPKQVIRNKEKEKLHAVNAEESSVLQGRWLSAECRNAVVSFLSRRAKL